jgi:hypothetical protein
MAYKAFTQTLGVEFTLERRSISPTAKVLRSCHRPHSEPSSQALVASREASYPSLRLPGVRHRRAGWPALDWTRLSGPRVGCLRFRAAGGGAVPSVRVAALVMPRGAAKGRRRARVLAARPAASVHALTLRSSGTGFQRASPASSQPLSYDVGQQYDLQRSRA